MDKDMALPYHMWKRMGEMGLLGMTASEEYVGMGLDYFKHCLVTE
jgi:isovaleryl-CoA dehydrogenase